MFINFFKHSNHVVSLTGVVDNLKLQQNYSLICLLWFTWLGEGSVGAYVSYHDRDVVVFF